MKAIHKRIGRGVRKYHRHFTKYLYERDTIFATLWVFVFIIALGLIPINFYFLNPLKLALKDFDINDVTYSNLGKGKDIEIDNRIVIINIGHADREGLSMIIDKAASMKPKVMGLDALFDGPREPSQDSLIQQSFRRHKNLVGAVRINWEEHNDSFYLSRNHFLGDVAQYGYVNFDNEDLETTRMFFPFKETPDTLYEFFASALVRNYEPGAYERLKKRKKKLEIINYTRRTNKYLVIEAEDLMLDQVEDTVLRGKIALLGYINTNPYDIEDKKFTPMNERFAGKSVPDMNGIVVHANIISMVLDNNYIKKLPSWVNLLVAVLICWLHMSFFVQCHQVILTRKILKDERSFFFFQFGFRTTGCIFGNGNDFPFHFKILADPVGEIFYPFLYIFLIRLSDTPE